MKLSFAKHYLTLFFPNAAAGSYLLDNNQFIKKGSAIIQPFDDEVPFNNARVFIQSTLKNNLDKELFGEKLPKVLVEQHFGSFWLAKDQGSCGVSSRNGRNCPARHLHRINVLEDHRCRLCNLRELMDCARFSTLSCALCLIFCGMRQRAQDLAGAGQLKNTENGFMRRQRKKTQVTCLSASVLRETQVHRGRKKKKNRPAEWHCLTQENVT
ncbi:hypothetical protein CEXT_772631 [Caerostris extrusa]|uniref:Uncharacterized protein n=1 Tax=Caerostris extrusa TaxID=172846 RepID=A0AAV4NQ86_CAEEX|nr:hypothetical protein CEXT_772631 [Caerostris extrusa]